MHYRSINVTRLNITISAARREFTCTSHSLLTRAYGVVPEAAADSLYVISWLSLTITEKINPHKIVHRYPLNKLPKRSNIKLKAKISRLCLSVYLFFCYAFYMLYSIIALRFQPIRSRHRRWLYLNNHLLKMNNHLPLQFTPRNTVSWMVCRICFDCSSLPPRFSEFIYRSIATS